MSTSLVARLQRTASQSPMVRGLLIGVLAISVTVGGVLAGALVVAPVVGSVSPPTTAAVASATTPQTASLASATRGIVAKAQALRARALTDVPEPVRLYATPVLAVVSIVSALAAVFLRREQPMRTLAPIGIPASSVPAGLARLTPRSGSRTIGRNSGKSPKGSKAVEAMAASGASTQDIAWKTGLPFDAVQLLLAISTSPRQLQPPSA